VHDERGISNAEAGWIAWFVFIIALGLIVIVVVA
jgi:hypothetical protein